MNPLNAGKNEFVDDDDNNEFDIDTENEKFDKFSKFSDDEIETLRYDLHQSGLDSWQSAELVSSFLSSRGYGVSRQSAQEAVARIDSNHCTIASLGDELEKLAMMM